MGTPVFPGACSTSSAAVEEILTLVGDDVYNMTVSIRWVKHLEVHLQPVACKYLYEKIKLKNYTDQPMLLLLLKYMSEVPVGVLDDVRAELESDCDKIIDVLVGEIKKKDYRGAHCFEINRFELFNFFVPAIVRKLDLSSNVEDLLLLLKYFYDYSYDTEFSDTPFTLINTLYKTLEENALLDSEQAMHVWAFTKTSTSWWWSTLKKDSACKCGQLDDEVKKYTNALENLTKMKTKLFAYYQGHVEKQDKQKIKKMHDQNVYLYSIVPEFVTFYYKGDLKRAKKLIAASKSVQKYYHDENNLYQLHAEMARLKRLDTFDAFCVYSEVNRIFTSDSRSWLSLIDDCIKKLYAGTTCCVRLLLNSSNKRQLRVINKYFDEPLCLQRNEVFCACSSENKEEQPFCAVVDPQTTLTTFSVSFSGTVLKLDASALDGMSGVAENATQWMIKPVDQHHVKIFIEHGIYIRNFNFR